MKRKHSYPAWLACLPLLSALSACAQTPAYDSSVNASFPPATTDQSSPALPQDPWPRDVSLNQADALIYQPQVESWVGNRLSWRLAVALRSAGSQAETFGVVTGTARTEVDRASRTVNLRDVEISTVRFPSLPDGGNSYRPALKRALDGALETMALDSLQASLAASQGAQAGAATHAVRNDPPKIVIAYSQAVLVPIDGPPVLKPMASGYRRVINTRAMLAQSTATGAWYLHVFDGWLSAPSLDAEWTPVSAPQALLRATDALVREGRVDLLDGGAHASPRPSLADGIPQIVVSSVPTELITFKGQPNLVPVGGTPLLWASNSSLDVLVDTSNGAYYILVAGRWFTAPSLNGDWRFVPSNALPAYFSQIPASGTPASVVLSAVAGTPQAQEARIANSIPQTASVLREGGPSFVPHFDGAPVWRPIEGTSLSYVANTAAPLIRVAPDDFYAVQGGVWFNAPAVTGPWRVATRVPEVIYTIPTSSALHYVTYVQIYGYTPQVVYVGYTPGYLGTVVTADGTVVFGTGYSYTPWVGSVWYAPPLTYGVAAMPVYNPYTGFSYGFALGLTTAAWWGGAYYHPGYWGAPCCGSASANVYRNWGGGVSSGTRTWYSNPNGTFGTFGSGNYATVRGTTGNYAFQRSYNPYTGQASQGYARSFNTAAGTTGNVARNASYNTATGQRTYSADASATGAGGSSVNRSVNDSAGPGGYSRDASTTTYNAHTGETKTWSNGVPQNNHFAGADGSVYRPDGGGGWQRYDGGGWQGAASDTGWAQREQQARSDAAARSGGFDGDFADRFGSGGFASHFDGGGFGGRFGGGGGFADRFGGGGFGGRFGRR